MLADQCLYMSKYPNEICLIVFIWIMNNSKRLSFGWIDFQWTQISQISLEIIICVSMMSESLGGLEGLRVSNWWQNALFVHLESLSELSVTWARWKEEGVGERGLVGAGSQCLLSLRSSLQINGFTVLVHACCLVKIILFSYQEIKHHVSDMYGHEQCSEEIIRYSTESTNYLLQITFLSIELL